jgi:hypothetical protein
MENLLLEIDDMIQFLEEYNIKYSTYFDSNPNPVGEGNIDTITFSVVVGGNLLCYDDLNSCAMLSFYPTDRCSITGKKLSPCIWCAGKRFKNWCNAVKFKLTSEEGYDWGRIEGNEFREKVFLQLIEGYKKSKKEKIKMFEKIKNKFKFKMAEDLIGMRVPAATRFRMGNSDMRQIQQENKKMIAFEMLKSEDAIKIALMASQETGEFTFNYNGDGKTIKYEEDMFPALREVYWTYFEDYFDSLYLFRTAVEDWWYFKLNKIQKKLLWGSVISNSIAIVLSLVLIFSTISGIAQYIISFRVGIFLALGIWTYIGNVFPFLYRRKLLKNVRKESPVFWVYMIGLFGKWGLKSPKQNIAIRQ